jgi:hypothetical protein
MKKIDEKRERFDGSDVDSSGNNGFRYLGHG